MDGTNPSILALERLDSVTLKGYPELMQEFPFAAFLVSLTFKNNHQCDLSKQQSSYMPQLPGRQRKKEVDVLLVDSDMGTLLHSTFSCSGTFFLFSVILFFDQLITFCIRFFSNHHGRSLFSSGSNGRCQIVSPCR